MADLNGIWPLILGAVSGGVTSLIVQGILRRIDEGKRRRLASMVVASEVRQWMSATRDKIYDIRNWRSSQGHAGKTYRYVESFPFEEHLDRVAMLDKAFALSVLELTHARQEANSEIRGAIEFSDDVPDDTEYEIAFLTSARTAQIYLDAEKAYRKLARRVRWKISGEMNRTAEMMKEEIAKFEERQNRKRERQAKFNAQLLSRTSPDEGA